MRPIMSFAAIATALVSAGEASAKEDEVEKTPPTWMMGAGVSLGGLAIGPGIGGLPATLYGAGVERRLSEALWLTSNLRGTFSRQEVGGSSPDASTSWFLDGRLGLRHVLNPHDRWQVSVLTRLGGFYGRSFSGSQSARNLGLSVDGGVTLDYWVTEMLALRLGTQIASIGYQRAYQGHEVASWFAELGLSPSFSLQVAF